MSDWLCTILICLPILAGVAIWVVPLPRDLCAAGVQRYGFHGLSYDYISSVLPRVAPDIATVMRAGKETPMPKPSRIMTGRMFTT